MQDWSDLPILQAYTLRRVYLMLTPVDLETMVFRRGLRGYRTQEVQNFMRRITADYEKLYKENFDLKEKIEQYEDRLKNYNEMEETLKNTLCMAQETAKDVRLSAEKQAEVILREAQNRTEEMKLRVREEIQTELQNLAELKQQVELFRIQFKRFLQTLIEMADRSLDLDEIWEKMMDLDRGESSRGLKEAAVASDEQV
jgi:cell division initiation protein